MSRDDSDPNDTEMLKERKAEGLSRLPYRTTWIYLASAVSAFIAVTGLVSYIPGLWILSSFGDSYIPMAPTTAICLLLAALVLSLRARSRPGKVSPSTLGVPILLILVISLLEIAENLTSIDFAFERFFAVGGMTLNGIRVGQMSLVTGASLVFIGAGLGLLIMPTNSRRRRFLDHCASTLGSAAFLIAGTFFLGYLYGTPFLYTSAAIPMAASTSLALLFLSLALIVSIGAGTYPLKLFTGSSTAARLRRVFMPLSLGSVVLTGIVVRSGIARILGNDAMAVAMLSVLVMLAAAITIALVARSIGSAIDGLEVRLRESEARFSTLFRYSPLPTSLSRLEDGAFIDVNDAGLRIFGVARREDFVGKTAKDLSLYDDPEDRLRLVAALRDDDRAASLETRMRTGSGDHFDAIITAAIVPIGGERYQIVQIQDITEMKRAKDTIKRLFDEKSLILKEVHHRIKNNLNTIHSLLFLQADAMEADAAKNALVDAGSRVQSMLTLYDQLYLSTGFTSLSLKAYLPPLVDRIISLFANRDLVTLAMDIDDVVLDAKQLQPLGVIVNELLTNIMKYAFVGKEEGKISIAASASRDRVTLSVQDDGNGIPDSVDFDNPRGFGMSLIDGLSQQLDGNLRVERGAGTKVVLEFVAHN
jgi:PAS domain S-box-containing protein